jgi:hypothetical protein
MASVIPKEVKKEQTDKWNAEVLYVALFRSTSNCATDGISTYAGCTNECTGTGYTAGGKLLTTSSAYSTLDAILGAVDAAWTGCILNNPARYAVVYCYSGTNAGLIRGVFDLGGDVALASSGVFTVHWNITGLIKVTEV